MPLIKMINDPYRDGEALHNVLDYMLRSASICGGLAVDPHYAEFQMRLVKEVFYKVEGRQIRHFIVSFADNEDFSLEEAYALAQKIALYYADKYQIIFAIHTNTDHLHIHFALNTVSYRDGKMYREGYGDYIKLKAYIASLFPGMAVGLIEDATDT